MNDDFFLLRPVDGLNDPNRWGLGYGSTFAELALKPGWRTGYYRECLTNTEKFLKSQGVEKPISYDRLHVPMKINLSVLRYVFAEVKDPILHRSAYGNLAPNEEKRFPEIDVKVRHFQQLPVSNKWLSTNNLSWRGLAGQYVRAQFPNKCKYEK